MIVVVIGSFYARYYLRRPRLGVVDERHLLSVTIRLLLSTVRLFIMLLAAFVEDLVLKRLQTVS